ncbi:MAG TPA: 3-dehydroquinate synthase [Phycisphaerae bacterium]|nr:3-dehydroquinate synthase [Phycisphaerae bacterium]
MQSIDIHVGPDTTRVSIGAGARSVLPDILDTQVRCDRFAVVVDATVARLHLPSILAAIAPRTPAAVLQVPAGEASKTLASAERLYGGLGEAEIGRDGLILALGGGMIGDLAGFVAATWLRGVPFVFCPTTTEAAIDASIGGKTAVNHPAGKNLIGAFHAAAAVVIDTDLLRTLPARDFSAGLAESVKHALIADAAFLAWHEQEAARLLRGDPNAVTDLILRNCRIKADIVARDAHERDWRAVLNFGHTVGHALEHVLGFELRHGECVALGMIAENEIARARGWLDAAVCERVGALLATLGLPTRLPRPVSVDEAWAAARVDKKVRGGVVRCVLLRGPAQPELNVPIDRKEMDAAVTRLAD